MCEIIYTNEEEIRMYNSRYNYYDTIILTTVYRKKFLLWDYYVIKQNNPKIKLCVRDCEYWSNSNLINIKELEKIKAKNKIVEYKSKLKFIDNLIND